MPWSSGQDASLSRWNQGFDSPRHYQMKTHRQVGFSVGGALLQGESDPKGQRRKRGSPADSRAAAGPSSRKRQRGCAGRRILRSKRLLPQALPNESPPSGGFFSFRSDRCQNICADSKKSVSSAFSLVFHPPNSLIRPEMMLIHA